MNRQVVAQVGNLLCRRLVVGESPYHPTAADCQSATQQTASPRYRSRTTQAARKVRGGHPCGWELR